MYAEVEMSNEPLALRKAVESAELPVSLQQSLAAERVAGWLLIDIHGARRGCYKVTDRRAAQSNGFPSGLLHRCIRAAWSSVNHRGRRG